MRKAELLQTITQIIDHDYYFSISLTEMQAEQGLREFNRLIRQSIADLPGLYLWENNDNEEIFYIGMAGKVNQEGQTVSHTVRNRMQASRKKDRVTQKDITTNKYLRDFMSQNRINQINIHVVHLIPRQLPSYAEAVLMNAYYQHNGILPRLNKAF
jgi:hypothetical protein